MDRKTFMKQVYSLYWLKARETIYGFSQYDRNLCTYISSNVPKEATLLDVAVGTGYPFADFFQRAGYSIYGIDIAPSLVARCVDLNPNINAKVGDAETLEYPDEIFDCAYCFHSTWYFPNLNQVVKEMLRVTRPGGLVIFDLQNANNPSIGATYRKKLFQATWLGRVIRYAKNIAKFILRRGTVTWDFVLYEVPTIPESIFQCLKDDGINNFGVLARKDDDSIEVVDARAGFAEFSRLVFAVWK